MINIKRSSSHNLMDCHEYNYELTDEHSYIKFCQSGSRDLMMIFYSYDGFNSMNISKDNYLLYKLIDKLYNNIISLKIYQEHLKKYGYENINTKYYQTLLAMLYDGSSITWKSDAPIEDNTKLYNYLKITKKDNSYELSFNSDMNKNMILVEFNTDRSRYEAFVFEFYDLLKGLKEISEPYRQITLDEYVYEKMTSEVQKVKTNKK